MFFFINYSYIGGLISKWPSHITRFLMKSPPPLPGDSTHWRYRFSLNLLDSLLVALGTLFDYTTSTSQKGMYTSWWIYTPIPLFDYQEEQNNTSMSTKGSRFSVADNSSTYFEQSIWWSECQSSNMNHSSRSLLFWCSSFIKGIKLYLNYFSMSLLISKAIVVFLLF